MKWNRFIRGHKYPGSPIIGRKDTSNFCRDRNEWVQKSEYCIYCDKYAEWDGANLECQDEWEWKNEVDENFEAEGFNQYTGYRVQPDDPDRDSKSDYDRILDKWFEEEQNETEEEEIEEVDAEESKPWPEQVIEKIKKMHIDEDSEPEEEDEEETTR